MRSKWDVLSLLRSCESRREMFSGRRRSVFGVFDTCEVVTPHPVWHGEAVPQKGCMLNPTGSVTCFHSVPGGGLPWPSMF